MMKYLFIGYLLISSFALFSQKINYNLDDGFIAEGYDVVSYFSKSPKEGKQDFVYSYKGARLKFANQSNLNVFKDNPEKYFPKYGGWCAYALGARNKKVTIDPETYEIRNGGLYLFYNSWGTNTFNKWLNENPNKLAYKAAKNWETMKFNK